MDLKVGPKKSIFCFFLLLLLVAWPLAAQAVTFCVDDASDGAANMADCDSSNCTDVTKTCSLRDAIVAANNNNNDPIVDLIIFNIPGAGVHTIQPNPAGNDLPDIIDPVFIDGYTQPGSSMNTLSDGSDAVLLIEIDGTLTIPGNTQGLALQPGSDGSTIRGLVIHTYTASSIRVDSQNNLIIGNFLGTDPTGNAPPPAPFLSSGVNIFDANNRIGGPDPAERNLISGNEFGGVVIFGTGNDNNVVEGNLIGTDVTGTLPLGNLLNGVRISGGSINNLVGGDTPGSANIIAFNSGSGVEVNDGLGNTIIGNSIHSNTENQSFSEIGLGIELGNDDITANDLGDADTGSNDLQNFPILTSAVLSNGILAVAGNLNSNPNHQYRVEFFANDACDPSGDGEGQTFLTALDPLITDGGGDGNINTMIPMQGGPFLTTTATDLSTGDTSEFSPCLQITIAPEGNCSDGLDDDQDGQIDCDDADCSLAPECAPPIEICSNAADDDGDSTIDCADPDCASAAVCNIFQVRGSGCSLRGALNSNASSFSSFYLALWGCLALLLVRVRLG